MSLALLTVSLQHERDVVLARQRSRQLSAVLGFETGDQTRISTAVSEIARNASRYARGGRVSFLIEGRTAPQVLLIRISDRGPGIERLQDVLDGNFARGRGITGARRLMDGFDIRSGPGGTLVELKKILPRNAPVVTGEDVPALLDKLSATAPEDAYAEIRRQNQELLATLQELKRRQDELIHLNRELEDTNRGVLALYAELDEKADHLRRADELKSRFLSNMSHEFRTPLNSILALSGLMLSQIDGVLNREQSKQVGYIRKAAQDLSELVSDLLDLAKVEAGKIEVRPAEFDVANLFGALRGMLRPLLTGASVELNFEEPYGLPLLNTDEGKVSQILRNFISNALKFTEHGEVRVSAQASSDLESVAFSVRDTGIGIAAGDHERIFDDFTQIDSALQRRVRGTGLGLPLTRKLATLLGGTVSVISEPGVGSTFTATIPVHYQATDEQRPEEPPVVHGGDEPPVLLVEDDDADALLVERFLRDTPHEVVRVATLHHARDAIDRLSPKAIILDIIIRGTDAWSFLAELKAGEKTRHTPVLVVTTVDDQRKALALGADAYAVKPISRDWLLSNLASVSPAASSATASASAPPQGTGRPILIVDNEEASRYILKTLLGRAGYRTVEASGGAEGLRLAALEEPQAIFLDLVMPEVSGFEVLEQLRAAPATRATPVIIGTSSVLTEEERVRLLAGAQAIFSKDNATHEEALSRLQEVLALAGLTPQPAS